ncbi:MAG: hypothetical protein VR64_10965 [Desulfatitalea sp. BRH_c12]|nr:MAG: hypothetical protein VR64_10965 [Desulfatitalea sp. BRH_c12]
MKTTQFTLRPYPTDRTPTDITLTGTVTRTDGLLEIHYSLRGTLSLVQLPPVTTPAKRRQGLWEQTCFECFLAPSASEAYWEVNLSPAGHWNVYCFDAYRRGMREEAAFTALPVAVTTAADRFELTAAIALSAIDLAVCAVKIAICAVTRTTDNQIAYWALNHPGPAPDFHHRGGFVLSV